MATVISLPAVQRRSKVHRLFDAGRPLTLAGIAVLTVTAIALLGYHPAAEDGGIYAAALSAHLDPSLFPTEHSFAVAHSGRSLFVPLLSLLARRTHLQPAYILLIAYTACLAATIAAGRALAKVLFVSQSAQRWSVVALAVSLGLPVAGTSLYLADPYLTARSLSTPLLLWAIALLLRRRYVPAAACLVVSFAVHPMMTATSAVLILFLIAVRTARSVVWTGVAAVGVLLTIALVHFLAPLDSAAVQAASLSRLYWFLSGWAWYEVAGLIAPLVLLPVIVRVRVSGADMKPAARSLAWACVFATAIVSAGMMLFVHPGDTSLLVARMQPMRLLHTVYLVFMILLGGFAGSAPALRRMKTAWLLCAVGGVSLFAMQRSLYGHCAHLELPWQPPANGYEQAFLWARDHTPKGALFALDAGYTSASGEDAQLFRAIALRGSLPDAAKDGGIASVVPRLAEEWQAGSRAQAGLAQASDEERVSRVKPLGATWIVLPASSATEFHCPYANMAAKVCRLP